MRQLQNTDDGQPDFPIRYYCVQPNRWTFSSDKIRGEVESALEGRVLNACAGKTKLQHQDEIIRNDLNPDRDADYHVDVCDISDKIGADSVDTVVYDPPFSTEQAGSSYDGVNVAHEGQAMREIDTVLRPGGRVIKFGFSTTTMPGELDYTRELVVIFNTLGRMNDWLMTVDKRQNHSLSQYE